MMMKRLSNNENKQCAIVHAFDKIIIITKDSTIECKAVIKKDEYDNEYYDIPDIYNNMLKELGFIKFEGQCGI